MPISLQGKCKTLRHLPPLRWQGSHWEEAKQNCEKEGGQLASFKTEKETEVLRYLYNKGSRTPFAFIGLVSNDSMTGKYRYA